jgi:hypothetical protein
MGDIQTAMNSGLYWLETADSKTCQMTDGEGADISRVSWPNSGNGRAIDRFNETRMLSAGILTNSKEIYAPGTEGADIKYLSAVIRVWRLPVKG